MNAFEKFIEDIPAQSRPPANSWEYKAMRRAFVGGLRCAAEIVRNNQILDTRYVPDHAEDIEAEALRIESK